MEVSWPSLMEAMYACRRCQLCQYRTFVVPGEGTRQAQVMLVGEGPGAQEDTTGRPFVGAAGKLLDKMLSSIGLTREEVYIANVVKCRPPDNRTPTEDEARACLPYLRGQFALIRPQIIVCLGATSAKSLIRPDFRIMRERGQWIEKKGVWLMPTYHPAALLRDEAKKRDAWTDFKAVRDKIAQLRDTGAAVESEE